MIDNKGAEESIEFMMSEINSITSAGEFVQRFNNLAVDKDRFLVVAYRLIIRSNDLSSETLTLKKKVRKLKVKLKTKKTAFDK